MKLEKLDGLMASYFSYLLLLLISMVDKYA